MKIEFTIPGEPKGKGRPRFSRQANGRITVHTPKTTAAYENIVRLAFRQQCKGVFFEKGEPLTMTIQCCFAIPKSTPEKNKPLMRLGAIRPAKKPDCDNIVKIIADSLNGLAYHDDAQITDMTISKKYANVPEVQVVIEKIL